MRVALVVLVFLGQLAPAAVAQSIMNEDDVRMHAVAGFTRSLDNQPPGNLVNETLEWSPPYSYDVKRHTLLLSLQYTATMVEETDGVWELTVATEHGPVDNCFSHVETANPGGFLAGDFIAYAPFITSCIIIDSTVGTPHQHQLYINRTVLSGSPTAPENEHFSIQVLSQDEVIVQPATPFETLTGLTGTEFVIFPALAIAGLFLWSRKDMGVSLFGSLLILFDAALSIGFYATARAWAGFLVFALVFMLAFGYTAARWFLDLRSGRFTGGRDG